MAKEPGLDYIISGAGSQVCCILECQIHIPVGSLVNKTLLHKIWSPTLYMAVHKEPGTYFPWLLTMSMSVSFRWVCAT